MSCQDFDPVKSSITLAILLLFAKKETFSYLMHTICSLLMGATVE